MNFGKALAAIVRGLFRRPKSRKWRAARMALIAVALAYAGLLTFPGPLFAHYHEQGTYRVWSDEPIDPSIRKGQEHKRDTASARSFRAFGPGGMSRPDHAGANRP